MQAERPVWMPWFVALALFLLVGGWVVFEVRTVGQDSRPAFLTVNPDSTPPPRNVLI